MTDGMSVTVECKDLAVGYNGEPILEGISCSVTQGSTLALIGRSGCGKSTLLKTLVGLLTPISGTATILGTTQPATPPAGSVGYIPQDLGLVTHATVMQNVLHGTLTELDFVRSLLGRFPPSTMEAAQEAIAAVGLAGMEDNRVKELSGGQRRRVAIARAFVQEPKVLFADEILSELDMDTAQSIVECLQRLQSKTAMAVIIVEHDRTTAEEISDQLIQVANGGIHPVTDTRKQRGEEGRERYD